MSTNHGKEQKESSVRKIYFSESGDERTFQYDESLPSLPVPELHQTIAKYLKSVEPFVSVEQYEKTKSIARNFENGLGKQLQEKLKARASEYKNWMDDWWYKYAYLIQRDPINPMSNMAGPDSLHLFKSEISAENALKETAMYLWCILDFHSYIREEKLKPQSSKKGEKLTMHQFRTLFNTVRIPGEGMDEMKSYFKTKSEGPCPNHFIVICLGHIWVLDPWFSPNERLTVVEMEEQLKYIRKVSDALGQGQGVGVLTFDNRDVWAKNRKRLMSLSERNRKNLDLIESSVAVCSLDENRPQNLTEVSRMTLCGDPFYRWADKSCSTVTFANGYHSTSEDHTSFDGMVIVVLGHFQYRVILDELLDSDQSSPKPRKILLPRRLNFDLDDQLLSAMQNAMSLNLSLRNNMDVYYKTFTVFGKNWMQDNKLHPDAFVQCSLQLAYYQLHKKLAPTYETATTRQFYLGRTETVRSCTQEMRDFVKAMVSPTTATNVKRGKLLRAMKRHVELLTECQSGEGIDRHLLGLSLIALEEGLPTPEIFTDSAFSLSGGGGNFVLSTSTLGYTPVLGGVAAMVKDGYGVFYIMLPEGLYFFMTNFKNGETCVNKFSQSLSQALIYMNEIVSETQSRL